MSNSYQIGLTQGTLINLIDDPFPESNTDVLGFTLSGAPINIAWETITWSWKFISQTGFYQIWLFWVNSIENANPPPYVYIRTLQPAGFVQTYGVYRCKMGKPTWEKDAPAVDTRTAASVTFYQCEQVA